MKREVYLIILLLLVASLKAQDVIVKKDGNEIKSKVIEITPEFIKYKNYDEQDGPVRNISKSDAFMIIYENGKREKFTELNNNKVNNDTINSSKINYDGNYFMIASGYGNSYGGLGVRVQWRWGNTLGIGIHGGLGYYPYADVLFSTGVKFFPYKNIYINSQIGLTGVEINYNYGYNNYSRYNVLFGSSFLVGGDWYWGKKVGFGFNAALGLSYNINSLYGDEIMPAIDMGFVVKF